MEGWRLSWLKIDDGFEDHGKVEPLSDAAHRLWMRAACWCRKPTNEHTRGFVPKSMLRTIARNSASQAKLEKLARELEQATAGGIYEHGLWEATEGGWQFHDWDQYQPEPEVMKLTRTEAARLAGQRSAEVRRERYGTAQPPVPERPPNEPKTFGVGSTERRSLNVPNDDRTPVPVPVPVRDQHTKSEDLSGSASGDSDLVCGLSLQARSARWLGGGLKAQDVALQFGEPKGWSEVRAVFDAFALGGSAVDVRLSSDQRVTRLLELFAAGHTIGDVVELVELALKHEFWRTRPLQLILRPERFDELRSKSVGASPLASGTIELSATEAATWR